MSYCKSLLIKFKGDLILNNISGNYYLFFQNMSKINGFKGFVGYSIRELDANEAYLYCSQNKSNLNVKFPLIQTRLNFTSDFFIRSYTSGCYYYDTQTGKWSSNGMEIYEDTNLEQTHCLSYHLTSFAAGLDLSSSIINFQYSFTNASFSRNMIIYITVILFICLYVLFAISARYKDTRDLKKLNIIPLKDNDSCDNYFYEIMVFTGNRNESETNSKV
jgi:polycystin 1L2